MTALRMRMRELAQARIRYGYRKIRVLLIREGWQVGKKLVYRVYREEGLGLRARPKARRTVPEHSRQKPRAQSANEIWSLDFVADQFTDGRRFRALTVVDARECLAIEVGQSLKGHDVVRVLQQIADARGAPNMLFCDNGSEFKKPPEKAETAEEELGSKFVRTTETPINDLEWLRRAPGDFETTPSRVTARWKNVPTISRSSRRLPPLRVTEF